MGGITIILIILFSQFAPRIQRVKDTRLAKILSLFPVMAAIGIAWLLAFILSIAGIYKEGDLRNIENSPWIRYFIV
jgi:hypothetical protein